MPNTNPTIFRTHLSSQDIQTLLESIPQKVAKTSIKDTIPADASTINADDVVSLKLLVDEIKKIDDFHTGSGLKTAIDAIQNFSLMSKAQSDKLGRIGNNFRGAFIDFNARDAAFPNVSQDLAHNDLILVIVDAGGHPSLQYWNAGSSTWVDVYRSTGTTSVNLAAIGNAEVAAFVAVNARSARYTITATKDNFTQMFDVTLMHDGVGNIFSDTLHEVRNPAHAPLVSFTAGKSPSGDTITLIATTVETNVKVDVQRTAIL